MTTDRSNSSANDSFGNGGRLISSANEWPTTQGSPALATVCVAAVAALFFNPIWAFAISLFVLLNAREHPTAIRRILALTAVTAVSLMSSARPITGTTVQDIVGYYDVYLNLRSGDISELFHYGTGLEVGTTLLFYLWALVLPKLTVNGLMLCLCLASSFLFVAWLETTFYSDKEAPKTPMLIGFSVLLMNLYFATQLPRQLLSGIILLFAISSTNRWRSLGWLTLATAFHLTAVPFYFAYILATRTRFGIPVLLVVALAFRLSFSSLVSSLDIVPDVAADKLNYYVDNDSATADLASLRFIALLCFISIVTFVASGWRMTRSERRWSTLPWVATALYILLLPIPLASLRTTLLVHSLIPGLVAYKISGRFRLITLLLGNALLLYKIVTYVTLYDPRTGTSTLEAIQRSFIF